MRAVDIEKSRGLAQILDRRRRPTVGWRGTIHHMDLNR